MKEKIKIFIKDLLGRPRNKKHEILRYVIPAIESWKIKGEFFEFGVYRGRTTIEAHRIARKFKRKMMYFAFDSFEGLPASDETGEKFYKGQYSCSEEIYLKNVTKAGINRNNIKIHKGFYEKSLTYKLQKKLSNYKAAVVWVDCDLYISTVPVLDFIIPFLQNGTIICFDDWFSFGGNPKKGELAATNEWLSKNKEIKLIHYKDFGFSGRSFIIQIYS